MTGWHERAAFPARPAVVGTAILLVAVVAPGFGGVASGDDSLPYTGVVTQETAEVRAGGGDSFYAVGSLKQGQLVEVHGHFYGWFKIRPPENVFSYIKRAFVNRHGDGNVGTVSDGQAMVWAAEANGTPGASFRQQRYLKEGERVIIVEQSGDFYRIHSPSDTYVFLPPGSVEEATTEDLEGADRGAISEEAPATTPSDDGPAVAAQDGMTATTDAVGTDPVPSPAAGEDTTPSEGNADQHVDPNAEPAADAVPAVTTSSPSEAPDGGTDAEAVPVEEAVPAFPVDAETRGRAPHVEAAEMRLNAVSELPLADQPIEELIATYEGLQSDAELDRHDRNLVTMRLKQLRNRQRLAATLRSVSDFRSDLKRRNGNASAVYEAQMKSGYAAVGRLLASIVYNGETLPVMYRVVEPGTYRTLAYVRPATRSQATRLLGRIVGVVGRSRFDTALKAQVVEAERLEILEPTIDQPSRDQQSRVDRVHGTDRAVAADGGVALAPLKATAR